jgi:hypothetical protein
MKKPPSRLIPSPISGPSTSGPGLNGVGLAVGVALTAGVVLTAAVAVSVDGACACTGMACGLNAANPKIIIAPATAPVIMLRNVCLEINILFILLLLLMQLNFGQEMSKVSINIGAFSVGGIKKTYNKNIKKL